MCCCMGRLGLGKTTLANIIANELGVHFQPTAAPLLQIKGDLTAIITNMQDKQVLFIDEIHRLQPVLEELLYSALEDYKLDIIIGQGPSARTHTLEVKPFTFVGATTRAGLISGAAAIAVWDCAAAGVLYAGRFAGDCGAVGGDSGSGGRRRGREGNCGAVAGDASNCKPVVAAGAGLCAGARRRKD